MFLNVFDFLKLFERQKDERVTREKEKESTFLNQCNTHQIPAIVTARLG